MSTRQNMGMTNLLELYQDRHLYRKPWSKELTIFLVEYLVNERVNGNWNPSIYNHNVIQVANATEHLNAFFNTDIPLERVHHRIRCLRERFRLFKRIINYPGVHWDDVNNILIATAATWEVLKQQDRMTKTYMYQGDPLYDDFRLLFEDRPVGHAIQFNNRPNAVPRIPIPQPVPRTRHNLNPNYANVNFYNEDSDSSID